MGLPQAAASHSSAVFSGADSLSWAFCIACLWLQSCVSLSVIRWTLQGFGCTSPLNSGEALPPVLESPSCLASLLTRPFAGD